MEYLDLCDENGIPTGKVISREDAHRESLRHRTAHVWIVRKVDGRWQVLLQKRSQQKDSFPGFYDTSSAGHIPAGEEPLPSALRELQEELGVRARADQLHFAGIFRNEYEAVFRGKPFRDNEVTWVYVYDAPAEAEKLTLQAEEVERVDWFDVLAVEDEIRHSRERFCMAGAGLELLIEYLQVHDPQWTRS